MMGVAVEMKRDVPAPDAVRTFALRLARKSLLKKLCPPDHPVLTTENQLIEAARCNLQSYLISIYTNDDFFNTIEKVKSDIVTIAEGRILRQVQDDSIREAVVRFIREEDLDVLVPTIN